MIRKYFMRFNLFILYGMTSQWPCFAVESNNTITTEYVIHGDINGDGKIDSISLSYGEGSGFYNMTINVADNQTIRNNYFIPGPTFSSKGGNRIFRGAGIGDSSVDFTFYFCGPEYDLCSLRTLHFFYRESNLYFTSQQIVYFLYSFSDLYNETISPPISVGAITFESYLKRETPGKTHFGNQFGNCILNSGRNSLDKIIDALESEPYPDWLVAPGCITAQLVVGLESQEEISKQTAIRYLRSIE